MCYNRTYGPSVLQQRSAPVQKAHLDELVLHCKQIEGAREELQTVLDASSNDDVIRSKLGELNEALQQYTTAANPIKKLIAARAAYST